MATELVIFPLQPGKYPDDVDSPAGQAMKDITETLSQQKGFQSCYWGREIENSRVLRMFIQWDKVEDHKNFMKLPAYGPFLDRFGTIWEENPVVYHTHFTPHPPKEALSDVNAGATEVLTQYFPTSYSEEDQKTCEENVKKLITVIEGNADGYRGSAGGWVEEDVAIPDGGSDKAKVYVMLIGWSSVEAHTLFRDTKVFKENFHLLRNLKDKMSSSVVHVSCVEA